MFIAATVFALLAVAQADVRGNARVTEKRGAIGASSPSGLTQAQQEAYIAKIRQYQQAQAQAQAQAQSQSEAQPASEVRYIPQTSKFTGSPVAYTSGGASALQYQPQQQAIAYSGQPGLGRQSASSAYSKAAYQTQPSPSQVPHFSLASDVSTFSYSSPVVKYSNLGLLSQFAGKQVDEQVVNYQSAAAPAPAQRTVYYQPTQQQSQAKTRVQYVPQYEAYSQQEQKSAEPAQNYVIASQKYFSPSQGIPQQKYVYLSAQEAAQVQAQSEPSSASPQQYVYQVAPQGKYQQQVYQAQPQYEGKAQAQQSVPQSFYVRIPQQYQAQQFPQQKHGVVYAN